MNILRSKKLQKDINTLQKWTIEEPPQKTPLFSYETDVSISPSIWDDIHVDKLLRTFLRIEGQIQFGSSLIQNPITSINNLISRQSALKYFVDKTDCILDNNKYTTLEWLRNISIINKNYLYNVLFPSSWYMKWLYVQPDVCTFYHWYNCYLTSVSSLAYPLSIIITPLWFIRNKLGWKISIRKYINLISQSIQFLKKTATSAVEWYRFLVVLIVYFVLYIYSTAQTIDLSIQLHKFRKTLMVKLKTLINIQNKVKDIYHKYGKFEFWKPFCPDINIEDLLEPLHYNSLTIYKVLTNEKLKENVKNLCKISIIHDTLVKLSDKLKDGWCMPTYGDETFIGNMKNPILINNNGGVPNPIRLEKHLVISGANAGGKTTYVKSLLWNILMGQSFGMVYGDYSQIKVYDGIMHHHRVKDITGDQSLFQAEMYKIKDSLDIIKNYKNVVYFMDEPMHSTHPIDGSIMLKSLMYHLSLQQNLKIVLTSHYFILQELETELPDKFKNLCVKAIRDKDNNIVFDFKIYKNGSHQTIGIELLEKEGFPEDIFKTATKIKNKLYPQ